MCRLARTRQATDDDKSRTPLVFAFQFVPHQNLKLLVVLDQRKGQKSELLIRPLGRNVSWVAPGANLRVLHSRSAHEIEYMLKHQRPNALVLMRGVNCVKPDLSGLPVRAQFVVNESQHHTTLLCHKKT